MHAELRPHSLPKTPRVALGRDDPRVLLSDGEVLAVIGFGGAATDAPRDPRWFTVATEALDPAGDVIEHWRVDAQVRHGTDGAIGWSAGGGWLFAAVEAEPGADLAQSTAALYAELAAFFRRHPDHRVLRMWNFIADINAGDDDDEPYKQFCIGRGSGMDGLFRDGYPAATAVGHHDRTRPLQVYCLAAQAHGVRVENPRQLSAWRYPREYGPVPPSFARAMRFPADDALAISGTAAIQGHASRHADDLEAQLGETFVNLEALLDAGGMARPFGARSVLRAYVRHREDAPAVRAFIAEHAPDVNCLVVHADICRRELLVEIDGWHYA